MGVQQISRRKMNIIERETGQEVLRAWSHGGHVMGFVTPDHRHGWWDKMSGDWGWEEGRITHYSSCQSFGDGT